MTIRVNRISENYYQASSESHPGLWYDVYLGEGDGSTWCSCSAFTFREGACKHIVAVLSTAFEEAEQKMTATTMGQGRFVAAHPVTPDQHTAVMNMLGATLTGLNDARFIALFLKDQWPVALQGLGDPLAERKAAVMVYKAVLEGRNPLSAFDPTEPPVPVTQMKGRYRGITTDETTPS